MALIGDIRRNPWILIVFIALGLGGFIFMDSFSGERSVFGSQQSSLGEINGQPVDQRLFNSMESTLYGNSTTDVFTRRNVIWNYFVEDAIIKDEIESLGGLGVSDEEMQELIFGTNLSPIVRSRFTNPQTGQVDFAQLNQLREQLRTNTPETQDLRRYWSYQEKEVKKERTQSKLNAMISKAMYAPTWQLNMVHQEQNAQVDFNYVRIPFGDIEDVEITDADFQDYIDKNKATLTTDEETRKVEYVAFDILPTAQDTLEIIAKMVNLRNEFEAEDVNDTIFINNNLGTLDAAYLQRDQINDEVADALFGQPAGTTFGPYLEGNNYRVAKLIGEKVIPDSVRSRHILLRATTQVEAIAAQARIDSMKTELEAGRAVFDTLAARFGTDGTRETGGDLGYIGLGGMVKPFNDLIFFHAEEGEYNTVITQFGIHLVEVTGTKFINRERGARIGYISEQIVPSEDTQDAEYRKALDFVSQNRTLEDLRAGASSMGLSTEVAGPLKANDYIFGTLGTGQTSRDLVKFAFNGNTSIGDVSSEIYTYQDPITRYSNKHVIAALLSVRDAGVPSIEDVREDIEIQVLNGKKAEMLISKLNTTDLTALANEYAVVVDSATNVNFNTGFAAGLGSEPKVVAAAFNLDEGQTSEAIQGNNGVYVLTVTRKSEVTTEPNIAQLRKSTSSSVGIQATTGLMQSLKKDASINDRRSVFF